MFSMLLIILIFFKTSIIKTAASSHALNTDFPKHVSIEFPAKIS